ncbi:MAG TPA: penicillin-binding transpeptidase domain-containing protein, partial [Steroidobacteraceae bacterium]|nr:penicillin-binding transpeptidase domain-containing protein [Steroidobacteraceae bacterium]
GAVRRLAPVPGGEVTAIAPADWERVIRDMVGVTQRGTAAGIGAHAPYIFGGKTGTAQVFTVARTEKYNAKNINERLRDHSWFICFAPADSPRIALAVIEENGGAGASAAAPIARKVLDAFMLDAEGKVKSAPARPAPAAAPAAPAPIPAAPPAPAPAVTTAANHT